VISWGLVNLARMKYVFGDFVLDLDRGDLRGVDGEIQLEPRAFSLLAYMVEHHGRLVDRDELIEAVWHGRIVSDAAISTAIKAVRQALEDQGAAPVWLKTLRGRGYRFDGDIRLRSATAPASPAPTPAKKSNTHTGAAPRLAVLPFSLIGAPDALAPAGHAIPAELISSLSRLRWLQVIARGSSFRFHSDTFEVEALRSLLQARYCLTGSVDVFGTDLTIAVELADTTTGALVWADRFTGKTDAFPELRPRIVTSVVSALDIHIPQHEAQRARLLNTENLDAWSSYHLGLTHVYRFNGHDNKLAEQHFGHAIALDPNFASAHSAMSFAKFQNVFLRLRPDREAAVEEARRFAEQALTLDAQDPQSNFAMGRVHWLKGSLDEAMPWLETAITIDPNYSRAYYTRGNINMLRLRTEDTIPDFDQAHSLSPLDPLAAAMLASRGLAEVQRGSLAAAIETAERAALTPRAHYVGMYPAVISNAMAGNAEKARYWREYILERRPDAKLKDFVRAMPFQDEAFRRDIEDALRSAGMPDID